MKINARETRTIRADKQHNDKTSVPVQQRNKIQSNFNAVKFDFYAQTGPEDVKQTRMALSGAYTAAKATDSAKLLPLNAGWNRPSVAGYNLPHLHIQPHPTDNHNPTLTPL